MLYYLFLIPMWPCILQQQLDLIMAIEVSWYEAIYESLKTNGFLFQKYRHVDNIMFENHTIADRFLDFWRKTGSQRMGYLYGRYTEHKDIPLGIRAEVAAIYEPPQVTTLTAKC